MRCGVGVKSALWWRATDDNLGLLGYCGVAEESTPSGGGAEGDTLPQRRGVGRSLLLVETAIGLVVQ